MATNTMKTEPDMMRLLMEKLNTNDEVVLTLLMPLPLHTNQT